MKHTIRGTHGHVMQTQKGWPEPKRICIPRSEAARNEYEVDEIDLREELSQKWNVCMDCWGVKGLEAIKGPTGHIFAWACGCVVDGWLKSVKLKLRKA